MPTPMTQTTHDKLTNLQLRLSKVFYDQLTLADPLLGLYNIQSSTKAAERDLGIGGLGNVPVYTGKLEYDSFETLYTMTYTPTEYAKGIAIQRALIDDDEYGVMDKRAQAMGLAFDRTVIASSASTFLNAFSASYLGPDSKALCATDHPYSPTDATTQSNKGTTALSAQAVIDTKKLMLRYKDSRGNPMTVMPDTIIVPPELEPTAREIVLSMGKPDTANNNANVSQAAYRVVTSPFLTDTNDWFMVDSRLAKMYLNWFWRIAPEFKEAPDSDYELVLRYRGYMRYSYGWDTWGWIYGHQV